MKKLHLDEWNCTGVQHDLSRKNFFFYLPNCDEFVIDCGEIFVEHTKHTYPQVDEKLTSDPFKPRRLHRNRKSNGKS